MVTLLPAPLSGALLPPYRCLAKINARRKLSSHFSINRKLRHLVMVHIWQFIPASVRATPKNIPEGSYSVSKDSLHLSWIIMTHSYTERCISTLHHNDPRDRFVMTLLYRAESESWDQIQDFL